MPRIVASRGRARGVGFMGKPINFGQILDSWVAWIRRKAFKILLPFRMTNTKKKVKTAICKPLGMAAKQLTRPAVCVSGGHVEYP